MGESKAKDLVFSGRFAGAEEALAMGLVDELVAPDHVYDAARGLGAAVRRLVAAGAGRGQGRVRARVRLPFMTSTDRTPDVAADAAPVPNPHATAEEVEAARHDSKLAQVLYHDWEAESYDDKWSISYDQRCIDYARGRFDAIVPDEVQREVPYDRALELGCGTGFFLLNLIQSGVARRGSVTDLSPGMVKVATRNGQSLGLDVDGRVADAEGIPYDDDTFDLVVGHAVLHHIPDVELVAARGGPRAQAGRPVRLRRRADHHGQRLRAPPVDADVARRHQRDEAARPERLASPAGGTRRVLARRRAGGGRRPAHLRAERPGADGHQRRRGRGRTASEEFTAAMLGWPVRTFEASVPPGRLGWGWAKFAFNSWTTLSWVDANVWRHVVPKGWFYNVMVTGVKPS